MTRLNNRGFVRAGAIEKLIIVGVIGIIAAIVIPQYVQYKNRSVDKEARVHAYDAYKAAQAFFDAHPNAPQATPEDITRYGYRGSDNIILNISGNKKELKITVMHTKNRKIYRVDARGQLSVE